MIGKLTSKSKTIQEYVKVSQKNESKQIIRIWDCQKFICKTGKEKLNINKLSNIENQTGNASIK